MITDVSERSIDLTHLVGTYTMRSTSQEVLDDRTPDIPEDPEHTPLKFPAVGQTNFAGTMHSHRKWIWPCIWGGVASTLGLALLLAASALFRQAGQNLEPMHGSASRVPRHHVEVDRSHEPGSSEDAQHLRQQPTSAPSRHDQHYGAGASGWPVPQAGARTPRAEQGPKSGIVAEDEICNVQASVPQVSSHRWNLSSAWRRVCEVKNNKDKQFSGGRNWCWVGIKNHCHWNLKLHQPWSHYQKKAEEDGTGPPLSEEADFHPLEKPDICDRPELGEERQWTVAQKLLAREWFRDHVAVYVISLPTAVSRWKMIKGRLDQLQIHATRVAGVDMRVPGALATAKAAGFVPLDYNFTRAQENAYSHRQVMGSVLGTMGCAAAHFKVQLKAIADGGPIAVVMEDDSWPSEDFVERLWSLVREELPCDWEVVSLLSRCGHGQCVSPHLMRVQPDVNEPAWRCHAGVNWGMHAVAYRTESLPRLQKTWKRAVFDEKRPHCMDVDVALASISDEVGFYAVPSVQAPGFVTESNHRSARWDINQAGMSTSTSTTTTKARLFHFVKK